MNLDRLIGAWLNGNISQSESNVLQEQLQKSPESRARFRDFTNLDANLREIANQGLETEQDRAPLTQDAQPTQPAPSESSLPAISPVTKRWIKWACAACLLAVVVTVAYQRGQQNVAQNGDQSMGNNQVAGSEVTATEKTIAGHAILRRVAGIQWPSAGAAHREGDVLPNGLIELDRGVIEIDFFCGASVVIEGPATVDLESDWSMRLLAGRLRANVPPAARGFIVKAADSEIIDLGTEFAVDVSSQNAHVTVIDGEVELRGGQHDGNLLTTGESKTLKGSDSDQRSFAQLSTAGELHRRRDAEQNQRLSEWKTHSQQLRSDRRLIAYFPIAESQTGRVVRNVASNNSHGHLVGPVDVTQGRFGAQSYGLEFDRLGSRVRTQIPGEFAAFTFACWVKIDSLEHTYNALFMGDGYENGEPHWQIRQDGCLMFSVMVDDTPGSGKGKLPDARLHHVYSSQPFWDLSKSGQWFHIAAIYDPASRNVTQYVNGRILSKEAITDEFYVEKLRIGAAEIGNWGQPLRKSPWFAVRNLNGTIDELTIYNAALKPEEVQSLYQQGKPLGY